MTFERQVNDLYFEWMIRKINAGKFPQELSYRKLLTFLHNVEFVWTIPLDENRASDGIDLRYRFAYENPDIYDAECYIYGPCSILEMMVALSIRCEDFMDDPEIGDRTSQWFWSMIANLGLSSMIDKNFDQEYAEEVVLRFLNREYEPDGIGGLFNVRHRSCDVRDVEIWKQLCWYLDSFT